VIWVFNDFGCLFIQLDGSRYDNGDQREGFFLDNILDGQVIFTRYEDMKILFSRQKDSMVIFTR